MNFAHCPSQSSSQRQDGWAGEVRPVVRGRYSLVKTVFERRKLRPQLDHSEHGVGVPVVSPHLGEVFAVVFQMNHHHFEHFIKHQDAVPLFSKGILT